MEIKNNKDEKACPFKNPLPIPNKLSNGIDFVMIPCFKEKCLAWCEEKKKCLLIKE